MAVRLLLLPLLVVLLHGWGCAAIINLQVTGVPGAATRVVAVVDKGGVRVPGRYVGDVPTGTSTATLALTVTAGATYRVRAIAYTAGTTIAYPAILRSGKTTVVVAPSGAAVSAQIALADITAVLDATPSTAPAGSSVTLAAKITDPGDTGAGATGTYLCSNAAPLSGNRNGNELLGQFERQAEGAYRLAVNTTALQAGSTLYYQFAYKAWDFKNDINTEMPTLFWPNLNAGGTSLTLFAEGSSAITITVAGLPAAGNRMVAFVDDGTLQSLVRVRVAKDYSTGQTSTTMTVNVPAASGYRVRVVAYAYAVGRIDPVILRTGKVIGVAAPSSTTITLADPAFSLRAGTPNSAPAGGTINVGATLVDQGDAVVGRLVAKVYSGTAPFATNLGGTEWSGSLVGSGSGVYDFSVPVTLPATVATTYYQFAVNAFDFNAAGGLESPHFCWPNLEVSPPLPLLQIHSTISSSILISVFGTPPTATRMIALVDGPGLTNRARVVASFAAGQAPATITVGVPLGGPYRVRLIAFRSGLSSAVILRSGKAANIITSNGVTASATVTLTNYTVTLDPSTPLSGPPGATVPVIANVTDPGETGSGVTVSELYGATSPFTQNLSAVPVSGLSEKSPDGTMKLSASGDLPVAGGFLYYQLAYEAKDFRDPDGVERPIFCWPNLEASPALALLHIDSIAPLYTITGKVTLNGAGLAGVTVALPGRTSAVTAADGAYSFTALPAGAYTVSAALANFTFSPASSTLTLASNQTLNFVASQLTGTIRVTVSELPPGSNRIVAVVDRGALPTPMRRAQDHALGQLSTSINLVVPTGTTGTGYRVRVVAFAGGSTSPTILGTGQATNLLSTASSAILLADPTFTALAGTPVSAPAGSTVSLAVTLADPYDAVGVVAVASVYSQTTAFTTDLGGRATSGLLQKLGTGGYRITAPVTLPATASTTYYQFAANASDFNAPGGLESPYVCWPNLRAGQALKRIVSEVTPSLFSITGGVTLNGTGLGGVTMSLSGLSTASTTTAADGAYSFTALPAGAYTVTATHSNYTFSPASSAVTLVTNQTMNFTAATVSSSIRITVSGTPPTATRLIAVVDQGGLATPLRTVADFAAGAAPPAITVGVPPGGPYRVRVIALRSGSTTPVILRSGKVAAVSTTNGATAAATVALADYTATLDPATPSTGPAGATVSVVVNVTDPGETAANAAASRLYSAHSAFTKDLSVTPVVGLLEKNAGGTIKLSGAATLPAISGFIYYQVAYEAPDFSNADGTERPLFCWPNLEASQVLKQIAAIPAPPLFTISGKVRLQGAALSGVTVSLSGLRTASVVTAADGAYLFAALPAGAYSVTATRAKFTFLPAPPTLTLASNHTLDFSVSQFTGTLGVSRSILRFGATTGGASVTAAQELAVDISDNLPVSWTVSSDKVWLKTTPAGGTGPNRFMVSIDPAAIPTAGLWAGTLTVKTSTSTSAQFVIQVNLAVSPSSGAPFGAFDTPANAAKGLNSNVPITGWALDDVGVKKVQIWRERVGSEPVYSNGMVFIADAMFVPDARPDIAAAYPDKPNNYRAGWGYLMLTNFLPNPTGGPSGNGTYKLHAIAVDEEGKETELGVKTFTVDNANAVKPFGTIDTPAQGATISGSAYINFGWALTPQPHKVAETGKTVWISIDGVFLGNVNYNYYRSDIAAAFPTYANSGGAVGHFVLDTTRFANGIHSIGWLVSDSAGRTDGIGSRFFFIRNTGPVAALAPGPVTVMAKTATTAALAALDADAVSVGDAQVEELGRVELQLRTGLTWRGRLRHGEDRVPLPAGSTLDSESGVFVWQLGAGFLGEYTLEFENAIESKTLRVVVKPLGSTRDPVKEGQVRF